MSYVRRGLWIAVFIAALVSGWTFAGHNADPVSVDYLFGALTAVPLWVALLTSFVMGIVATALGLFGQLTRSSLAQRRYRKAIAALESEVHQLRNLPVEAERADAAISAEGTQADVPSDPLASSLPVEVAR